MSANRKLMPVRPWRFMGIAENDQALGGNGQCVKFECSDWVDGVLCRPDLELSDRYGFWVCPSCGASYGAEAVPPQPYPPLAPRRL